MAAIHFALFALVIVMCCPVEGESLIHNKSIAKT